MSEDVADEVEVVEPMEEEYDFNLGESPTPDEEEEFVESEAAPKWVKELRAKHKELVKENKELKKQLTPKAEIVKIELRPKPKLGDFDFDDEAFENEYERWLEEKRDYDAKLKAEEDAKKAEEEEWNSRVASYSEQKAKLNKPDFDEVESVVFESLTPIQQGSIVDGFDNPAAIVYALGKNPARLAELAKIKSPARFIVALTEIQNSMRKSTGRTPPPPERKVVTDSVPGYTDKKLEQLRAKADQTGDFSEVIAYKKQLRNKQS